MGRRGRVIGGRDGPPSRAVGVLLAAGLVLACGSSSRRNVADIPTEDLRGSPLYKVLEPDEIPSIDDPQFVPADRATFMKDGEPVLGVFDGRVAKAYSLWLLDHHEIVNDTLGDLPIAATW